MPGGRQAYMPALKVCPLPRSTSSPSRIQTSSQKSWRYRRYVPVQRGGRFSRKARTPSWKSALP